MQKKLYSIEFVVDPAREDEVSAELFSLGAESVSTSKKEGRGVENMVVNCIVPEQMVSIVTGIYALYDPIVKELREDCWKYNWENSFKGVDVTRHIKVIPIDQENTDDSYQMVIRLDPRDAFGAGTHPTTKLCCEALYAFLSSYASSLSEISMLDIGTGTGILAIVARKMGIIDVDAIDLEPDAVRKAHSNCSYNDCSDVELQQADISTFATEKRYSLITANVLTGVIEHNLVKMLSLLVPGGTIILSGIGEQWDSLMKDLFASHKVTLRWEYSLHGWKGYCCTFSSLSY